MALGARAGPVIYGSAGIGPVRDVAEEGGLGTSGGKRDADAGGGLDDAGAEFFNRRRRMVANSAVASASVFGMASRTARISQ